MKIRRLNEDLSTETWTVEKFEKIDNIKKELKEEEKSLHKLLIQYIKLNPHLIEDVQVKNVDIEDIKLEQIYIVNYYFSKESTISRMQILFNDCTGDDDYIMNLTTKEFDDLLYFLKDPNAYKQIKKYNL